MFSPPTPGVISIFRLVVLFLAAPATVTLLPNFRWGLVEATKLPSWFLITASFFFSPLFLFLHGVRRNFAERREAIRMGARLVPRPRGRWLGNLDLTLKLKEMSTNGYPGEAFEPIMKELGPAINLNVLWQSQIFTTCPEHIQIILATDFYNYVKGKRFQEALREMLGVGVFNADGDMWKFHRSMTRPFFSRDRITHFELFDKYCEQVIGLMKARVRTGYALDFQDLMYRFTLDAASEFLFGSCLNVLHAGELPYPHFVSHQETTSSPISQRALAFSDAFLAVQVAVSQREIAGPIWPFFEIKEDKAKKEMDVINAYVEPIVQEALRKKKTMQNDLSSTEKDAIDNDETLLDHLVAQTEDPKILKDETLNILLAGRDTTAVTLTMIFYNLSLYPDILKRLRKEIIDHIGLDGKPTFDNIKELKYLRAVINETLRLYPVVPFNVREAVNSTTWPSPDPNEKPLYVPGGAKTAYSVFLMHRRKDLWGPDAEVFDPDRFIDARLKKYLTPRPFIFLPFNAGPRICLGQQFAYNEMSFMIIRLLQNLSSFSLDDASFPPEFRPLPRWKEMGGRKAEERFFPKLSLTLYAGGGMWLKATEAKD